MGDGITNGRLIVELRGVCVFDVNGGVCATELDDGFYGGLRYYIRSYCSDYFENIYTYSFKSI